MTLHALARAGRPGSTDDLALVLLRAHLDARHYAPCVAAAQAIVVPAAFDGDEALLAAAACAVAQTFGLLDAARDAQASALVRAGLAGAADRALEQAAPDVVLAWCIAAAEWCERHGLDHEFSRLQPRAAVADASGAASPWARVHWRLAAAWHHDAFGREGGVAALLADALALAEVAGDLGLQVVVWLLQARLSLSRSAPEQALALAARAAAHADERHTPLWLAHAADVDSRVALIRGDMHRALHQARRARGLADLANATPAYTMTYRLYEAYALLGLGAWDEAVVLVRELAAIQLPARLTERIELLAQLFGLVRDDRRAQWSEASASSLAAVLRRLRELDWPGVLVVLPDLVARLWARALEAHVEADWVRASIISRDLPPPEPAWPTGWPWAVRIHVLGPFACVVGGRDLAATPGKSAVKTLALLRRLAAEGGYAGVASDVLALDLWPGEGREGRDKALETTLARLRRMLGHADAVLLYERRLRLNPRRVWLDSAALVRALEVATLLDPRGWDEALGLWRGAPLSDEGNALWVSAWRERQRMRLAAALLAAADQPSHLARRLRAVAADPGLGAYL